MLISFKENNVPAVGDFILTTKNVDVDEHFVGIITEQINKNTWIVRINTDEYAQLKKSDFKIFKNILSNKAEKEKEEKEKLRNF